MSEKYTLNGIDTYRYVYTAPQWPVGQDYTKCDPPICHTRTRPYYCLTEDGSVYLTTPDGIIYYMGADMDAMIRIYPLNTKVTAEIVPPGFDNLRECNVSSTTITLCWTNPNEQGTTWEQMIRPTQGDIVPWRPGTDYCSGEVRYDSDQKVASYVLPTPSDWTDPKHPTKMTLPYCNGYYNVQVGPDHCVTFYKGSLIYEGKYNGQGVPATFAYGVAFCYMSELCCPVRGTLKWSYQQYPKWQTINNSYIGNSLWDTAYDDMQLDKNGDITYGNIVHSNVMHNQQPVQSYNGTDPVTLTVLNYIASDWKIPDMDDPVFGGNTIAPSPTDRYCTISAGTGSDNVGKMYGYVLVNLEGWILDYITTAALKQTLQEAEATVEQTAARLATAQANFDATKTICGQLNVSTAVPADTLAALNRDLEELDREHSWELDYQSRRASLLARIEACENHILNIQPLKDAEDAHTRAVVAKQTLEYGTAYQDEKILKELVGNRVLWSYLNNCAWAQPDSREQIGSIAHTCDYEFVYTCAEKETWYPCESGGAAPVAYKTWYEGTDTLAEEGDSRYQISTWMEEGCKICYSSQTSKETCSKYKIGGGGCACTAPKQCGQNYPIMSWAPKDSTSVTDGDITVTVNGTSTKRDAEPTWVHLPQNECNAELAENLKRAYPSLCESSVEMDNQIVCEKVTGYCTTVGEAKIYSCPPNNDSETPTMTRTVKCVAKVATAKTESLGGRIIPVMGSKNLYTQKAEATYWAYIIRDQATCRNRKDYTLIGPIASPANLPGMVQLDKDNILDSVISRNAASAFILRAPHSIEHDNDAYFTGGWYLESDPVDVKKEFVHFYPAYLTRPGFEIPLKKSSGSESEEPVFYNIHKGIYPPAPNPDTENSVGEVWHFVRFVQPNEDDSSIWAVEWRRMITVSALLTKCAGWRASESMAAQEEPAPGYYNTYESWVSYWKVNLPLIYSSLNQDNPYRLVGDVYDTLGTPVIYTKNMPLPPQDPYAIQGSYGAGEGGIIGKWYCRGYVYRENMLWNATTEPEGSPDQESGIWWKQYTNTWGDPQGLPIRTGLQVGDVFYHAGFDNPLYRNNLDTRDEVDRYWYWTGFQWADGSGYYSDIIDNTDSEIVLFYQNKGTFDLRPIELADGSVETCGQTRAMFMGKMASIVACGDLMAVNLNADSTHRKVLYRRDSIVWEQGAYGTTYYATNGDSMQEGMVCVGDTYVLTVYNVGSNQQRFHMWFQDFPDVETTALLKERTVLGTFINDYAYNDVPNIFDCASSWVSTASIQKYGKAAIKNYLILPSRDGKLLYLWYKAELRRTYTDGSVATYVSNTGGVCGPRYAIIQRPSGHYDIWLDGVLKYEDINCGIMLNGAILTFPVWSGSSICGWSGSSNIRSSGCTTAILTDSGESLTWAYSSDSTAPYGCSFSASCDTFFIGSAGDWSYYLLGNCPAALIIPPGESTASWGATWVGYIQNSVTEEFRAAAGQSSQFLNTFDDTECTTTGYMWTSNGIPLPNAGSSAYGHTKECYYLGVTNFVTSFSDTGSNDARNIGSTGCEVSYSATSTDVITDAVRLTGIVLIQTHVAFALSTPMITTVYYAACGAYTIWMNGDTQAVSWDGCMISNPYTAEPCGDYWGDSGIGHNGGTYAFGVCSFPGISCGIAKKPTELLEVNVRLHTLEHTGIANACDCNNIVRCGSYSQYYSGSAYITYYKAVHLDETVSFANGRTGTYGSDGEEIVVEGVAGCCSNGTVDESGTYSLTQVPDGEYALFHNGHLYYKDNMITTVDPFSSWVDCCGNATILLSPSGQQTLYIDGGAVRTWNGGEKFSITCCGYDYYVIQRGEFTKTQTTVVQYTSSLTTTTIAGVTKWFTTEKCALNQTLRLDDGTLAVLSKIKVYCGKTKLFGTAPNQHQRFYWYERPSAWTVQIRDKAGRVLRVEVPHDYTYAFKEHKDTESATSEAEEQISSIADDLSQSSTTTQTTEVEYSLDRPDDWPEIEVFELLATRTSYIPWAMTKSAAGREAYTYYKTTLLSDDPRISNITCFRYRNLGTDLVPQFHGTAAFTTFYDDPYNNVKNDEVYTWETKYGDNGTALHYQWIREQNVVKDSIPLYDIDEDVWDESCNCEVRAKILNTNPNVCLMVWNYSTVQSTIDHTSDQPLIPFDNTYARYRPYIVYINDYNSPVRWDRLTGSDPVDSWQHGFRENSAGKGDFWVAAPSYNGEMNISNNPQDYSGRLIAAGNNTIFVWDANQDTKMEFNALTGAKIIRVT